MNSLRLHDEVHDDLKIASEFYESCESGAGKYFARQITKEILVLRQRAGFHRKIFGFHKFNSGRFPYAIYYLFDNGLVTVTAVLDMRQHPATIREILSTRKNHS